MKCKLICVALALALLLTGCQLAKPEQATGKDRLVGVFVTLEYLDLFDEETYFEENAQKLVLGTNVDTGPYNGRVYAVLEETAMIGPYGDEIMRRDYVFPDLEGHAYFAAKYTGEGEEDYWGPTNTAGITVTHTGYVSGSDGDGTKEGLELEGTVYLQALDDEEERTFYLNPVYQTADGRVYTVSGNGMVVNGSLGLGDQGTQSFSEELTMTVDGEQTRQYTEIAISFVTIRLPRETVILSMDARHQCLQELRFASGQVPDSLELPSGTAYVLLENHGVDPDGEPVADRTLYDREDELLETYEALDNGLCVRKTTELLWAE